MGGMGAISGPRPSDPGAVAKADQAAAKITPTEQRIKKANANPALWDSKHNDHEAARKELREAVAANATPEERAAMADAPLEEHRSAFGLGDPDEVVLPKAWLAEYNESYSGWERDFLEEARVHGLDSATVRDLRGAGIRLAIEADGRRVSDAAMDAFAEKFKGRLKPSQMAAIKAWWRGSVEGGDAS